MNMFNNDYDNKADLTDPVPEQGLKRYLFILSNHFFGLMECNLLFLLFCLPVVTIPSSLCALTRVLMILYHTGNCSPWQDFLAGFRPRFAGRFLTVFLLACFPFSAALWFFIAGNSSFGVGAGLVLFPVCFLTLTCFIALSASNEGPSAENVKRAFLLVFTNWRGSFKLLLVPILPYFLSIYYYQYALLFSLFITFSAGQLALCSILEKKVHPDSF